MEVTPFVRKYLDEVHGVMEVYSTPKFDLALELLWKCYMRRGQVLLFGNGGSAGTSNHMANDLSKGTSVPGRNRLKVLSLSDNISLITAYANDCGYETVFEEQIKSLLSPGDVCIAISCSGNSENVVRAAQYARNNGADVIGLVGFTGGKLKELSTVPLHFETFNYGVCEDLQLMFGHLASQYLCERIKNQGS